VEAREKQRELRKYWVGEDRIGKIRTVAGLDASFVLTESQSIAHTRNPWNVLREANRGIGCAVLFRYPEMDVLERAYAVLPLNFPYVPGLLSFREIPVLLEALRKLKTQPDLLFCDGHGYAHPRRFGLACHIGVLLNKPSIGCGKSLLIGTHGMLSAKAGTWTALIDEKAERETIGAVVRTRDGVNPIYVSQGHRVSLETAVELTLSVREGYRIPRPTRLADQFASEIKKKVLRNHSSEK